ncbi:MAG: bifunctional hydroxymethylpyrimidine kinase/phosphomethylpyrimidine kinase [Candidatus Cloacimonetes bacterium]|nr:bifunctional hydroxymethylpyrimidine kinase/phosphomethylpyrimidine kinase [Candidatus Cloacimonadota bacterium]
MTKYCLTIAASDTSGGAGIQRDLKVFHDNGVWGLSVITGITAQDFNNVFYANSLDKNEVEIQLKTIFENFRISAIKIGVVFNQQIMKLIKNYIKNYQTKNIIIDPIISSSDGSELLNNSELNYLKEEFLKIADLITPNIPELEFLSEKTIQTEKDIISNAKNLSVKYDSYIFVKGGHFNTNKKIIKDYLIKNGKIRIFKSSRQKLSQTHGTGCIISSAITANIAKGLSFNESIIMAKEYFNSIMEAI